MKIILLVTLVMALGHGAARGCSTILPANVPLCSKPLEVPVQLPVPKDFDYVKPSVVKLKQCTGLYTEKFPKKCFPTSESMTTKTYMVKAYREKDNDTYHCKEVQVVEHGACESQCEKIKCPHNNMIVNKETCKCECDPKKESECNDLRYRHGIEVMWWPGECSCDCNKMEECGSGMTWAKKRCRCVFTNQLD